MLQAILMTESPSDITLNYEVAKDLIDTKQELLRKGIKDILDKWGEASVENLIRKAKSGEIEEAEHDAIVLTNYIKELEHLEALLKK